VGDLLQDFRACKFDATSIVCAGADSPSCLTPPQAKVANLLWQGPVDPQGDHLSAGDMPRGSELAWPGVMVLDKGAILSSATSIDAVFSDDFPNYMAMFEGPTGITWRNIVFDKQEFKDLNTLSGIYDPTNPDLSAFSGHGGKLLLWAGWADSGASPYMVLNYYDAVRTTMGVSSSQTFMTLYLLPGVYHCNGGPTPTSEDFLTPLIKWVEDGTKPGKVVVSYAKSGTDSTIVKTRPAFPYPNIAVYTGSGDINDAANFVEAPPLLTFSDHFEWLGSFHYKSSAQQTCDLKTTANGVQRICK
jgi:hypothetical protein